MRGLTDLEREELLALDTPGEREFHGPTIDDLESTGRIVAYDLTPDGCYRLAPTHLGRLALKLWPLTRAGGAPCAI